MGELVDKAVDGYAKLTQPHHYNDLSERPENVRSVIKKGTDDFKSLWKQAFSKEQDGITVSKFFGSFKTSLGNFVNKVTDKLWTEPRRGDNIFVPATTKTLLGEDFAALYPGEVGTKTIKTTDGDLDCLDPKAPYSVQMHPSCLFSEEKATYGALSPVEKAAYECVLLTKKCASKYDGTNKDEVNQEYDAAMSKYKDYCNNNGIEWGSVQNKVSNELQAESAGFRDLADKNNLYTANLAHNLFLHNAGPDYKDPVCHYVGWLGYSYDDTLSLDMSDLSTWKAIKNTVRDAVLTVTSGAHSLAQTGIGKAQTKLEDWQNKAADAAQSSVSEENKSFINKFKDKAFDTISTHLSYIDGTGRDGNKDRVSKLASEFGTDYSKYDDQAADISDGSQMGG